MNKHPDWQTRAGISPERFDELQSMCRQYPRHLRHIRRVRAGIVDKPRHRGGGWRRPDPTGNTAAAIADALAWEQSRVKLIEDAANACGSRAVARAVLRNVTEGKTFEALRPPCGKRQFYDCRKLFFIELDGLERQRFNGL